jgi:hypothetical protein
MGRAPSSSCWRTRPAFIRPSSTSPSSAPTRWPRSSEPTARAWSFRRWCRFRGIPRSSRRRLPGRPNGSRFHPVRRLRFAGGYLSGRLAAAALVLAGPHPTRAGLLQAVHEVGRFDISGSVITVGPKLQRQPRSSSPSFRRTDRSRPSTSCDAVTARQGLEPVASAC